jgi:hypothetical protein
MVLRCRATCADSERPTEVVVDPDVVLIDTDRSNNRAEVTQ